MINNIGYKMRLEIEPYLKTSTMPPYPYLSRLQSSSHS